MWRTDETCSAAYLLLLVLLLRLLTGLRSADGACEPRCLHPPSSPPWIENNLCFNGSPLPGPSPLITLTTWMRYALHVLIPTGSTNLQVFGSPPAATPPLPPSLLLLVSVLHHRVSTSLLFIFFALLCFFCTVVSWSYSSLSPSPDVSFKVENTTAWSSLRWKEGIAEAAEQQECGWSFTMLGRLTYSTSAVKAMEKTRIRDNILSHLLRPVTAKTCSPSPEGKKTKTTRPLSSAPRLSFSVFLSPGSSFRSVLDRPLSDFPAGQRSCLPAADWLSDTATLTDLHHVTVLLAEHLT